MIALYDRSLTKKELGRKWAALLGRECRSSAKPCDSTIYFRGGEKTRKRFTVCSNALMSTGFERCSSIPASLLDFYFTENKCKLFIRNNFFVFLIVFNVFRDSID